MSEEKTKAPKKYLRDILGCHMVELGKSNDRVILINADLMGTCRTKTFADNFPERSFNVGIAEQNMISFAAGMAHEGFIPYVFSMAPFISMRACEQCRTDVAYSGLNVRMMAIYAGCSGGISGATHWAIEDCSIMGGIPGMTILEPCDATQAKQMLRATLHFNGPVYIRSSIESVEDIYGENYIFKIGTASTVRQGNDGAFLCAGVVVQYALKAADIIKHYTGKEIRVVDMSTIKPIDRKAVIYAAKTGNLIVAQDHNIVGGLGYFAAAVLAEEHISVNFRILGIPDIFSPMAHASYLYHKYGYDTEGLAAAMLELLGISKQKSCWRYSKI